MGSGAALSARLANSNHLKLRSFPGDAKFATMLWEVIALSLSYPAAAPVAIAINSLDRRHG
jgi:hypothetical protein